MQGVTDRVTSRVRSSRLGTMSLRTQLVLVTGFLLLLAISVTTLVAITALHGYLVRQIDQNLRDNLGPQTAQLLYAQADDPLVAASSYSTYILNAEGEIVRSRVQAGVASQPDLSGWNLQLAREHQSTGISVPSVSGSTEWRIMSYVPEGSEYAIIVGTPMNATYTVVPLVAVLTITFGLATLMAAIALSWVLVTRAFEPLARVERTAARIAAGDLSQRIEEYNPHTEIGQLSRSLNVMLTRIEEAFDAQKRSEIKMRRFVGDASHELRTPLVTIRGYSELYRHGALQEEAEVTKAMSRIEAEAQRMGQLVEDLLTLARMDDRRPSEVTDFDLLDLAQDAAADAAATAPDRVVQVQGLEQGPPLPAPVRGDESRIRQVLANLLTNALRYTPAGSPLELAVGVEPSVDGGFTSVVRIIDHGPGISPEDAERVFERFYRADTSRTRETGGTGLGLAIVTAIVAQHDGTVRVEQTEGGGATMVVRIPQVTEENGVHRDPHTGKIRP